MFTHSDIVTTAIQQQVTGVTLTCEPVGLSIHQCNVSWNVSNMYVYYVRTYVNLAVYVHIRTLLCNYINSR